MPKMPIDGLASSNIPLSTAQAHSSYLERNHFKGLGGIRCVAIVAVIWHHATAFNFPPILGRGFLGVDLFFILSGFLISTLLIREKGRNGRISLKQFWMRRALRLMPAYYVMLLLLLMAMLALKPQEPTTAALLKGFPVYALYLSNWLDPGVGLLAPTWSLSTEEQFYLAWPIVEAVASPTATATLWGLLLGINQLLNFGVLDATIETVTGYPPSRHPSILDVTFTPILLGVGLAHLLNSRAGYALAEKVAGYRQAALVFGLFAFALLNVPISDISGSVRFLFHVTATLFIASLILAPDSVATRIFEARPIAFIGSVSYGMYLYHMFALHAARAAVGKLGLPDFPATVIIGLALTIGISAISFYILEQPFLRLQKRFRPGPCKGVPAASAITTESNENHRHLEGR